jgi:hypothetical protein
MDWRHISRQCASSWTVKPSAAILDLISNLASMGNAADVYATLLHMIDSLKNRGVTSFCPSFTEAGASDEPRRRLCQRRLQTGRAIYFAFEESATEIVRNMRSIGIDLECWVKTAVLLFYARRPTVYGLETHLATMHQLVDEVKHRWQFSI